MRVVVAAVAVLFAGCARTPGPPVSLRSFVLHDVQGLEGGWALWAAEDRAATVQVVGRGREGGLWDKRYAITLTPEQWAEVERLFGAHHLAAVKPPTRKAIPEETHPIIMFAPHAGPLTRVTKWGGDKHPDFDPVYAYLLALCQVAGPPVWEGPFDWERRPNGFARPWE